MEDAVRIPIDVGFEATPSEAGSTEQVVQPTTVQEDGTLVIDILAPQPCAVEPNTGGEIVVCAQVDGDPQRMPKAAASSGEPEGLPKAQLSLGPNAKVVLRGETEARSGSQRVMIDFKVKF